MSTFKFKWTTILDNVHDGEWSHSGISTFHDGKIIFANLSGDTLVIRDVDTRDEQSLFIGTTAAHGIVVVENQIWVADIGPSSNEGQVLQLDKSGKVEQTFTSPKLYDSLPGPWKPTSIALVQDEGGHINDLWIADGYGQSLVHCLRNTGEIISLSGAESGLRFDCPHGVVVDSRNSPSTIAVADRGNKRLVFFDLDGNFIRSVSDPIMTSPSSIAVWHDQLVITDLFGAVLSMDSADKIHYVVETSSSQKRPGWPNTVLNDELIAPKLHDGIPNSPHGIAVDHMGRIFFTEWLIGGRVVMLEAETC